MPLAAQWHSPLLFAAALCTSSLLLPDSPCYCPMICATAMLQHCPAHKADAQSTSLLARSHLADEQGAHGLGQARPARLAASFTPFAGRYAQQLLSPPLWAAKSAPEAARLCLPPGRTIICSLNYFLKNNSILSTLLPQQSQLWQQQEQLTYISDSGGYMLKIQKT